MENRVKTRQAAAELGMSYITLTCLMQQDRLPIGYAFKRGSKWTYFIYRRLLDDYKKQVLE